jgi:hypothetical protein
MVMAVGLADLLRWGLLVLWEAEPLELLL